MKQFHRPALAVLIILILLKGACQPSILPLPETRHSETQWRVTASLPLEPLAFLNALTSDPLVGAYYIKEASGFKTIFIPAEEQAARRLAKFRQKTLGAN